MIERLLASFMINLSSLPEMASRACPYRTAWRTPRSAAASRTSSHRRPRGDEVRLAAAERGVRQAVRYGHARLAISGREDKLIMKEASKRSIIRWIHIIFGIPILGYIYDSPSDTPNYASTVRYVLLPVLLLPGLWMWKGHVLRRLLLKRMKTGQELEA